MGKQRNKTVHFSNRSLFSEGLGAFEPSGFYKAETELALHVGQWDGSGGSWSQEVIMSERTTIAEDRGEDAGSGINSIIGSATNSVWLSLMSYFRER